MLSLLLLLQFPSDIVVTGQRLVEVQAECARGGCTPLRDAQATIALAEVKFRDGAYQDAKKLLAAAISRNRDDASAAPRPVAAIYEAYSTVALHEGDKLDYRRAVANQVRVLKDNLPADDAAVVAASTALGDMWIELRDYRQAELTYRGIEENAREAGQDRAAMMAGMKLAWIQAARGEDRRAYALLNELEARPLAQNAGYATALRVLRLRIAARGADDAKVTELIAALNQGNEADPVLIWSPGYDSDAVTAANNDARKFGTTDAVQVRPSDYSPVTWVDVGFWIRPDGRTEDIEILRGTRARGWTGPVLRQIAARRYSASGTGTGDQPGQGQYRVERYTQRTDYFTPTNSFIKRRVATGGFDVLDLTEAPAAAPE